MGRYSDESVVEHPHFMKEKLAEYENEIIAQLSKLDLSPNEAKILLYLMIYNSSTASEIAKLSGVARTDSYYYLSSLLAKGVLRADDARRVLDAGFQGVIVSNHGGRQVDGAVAALDALVEVRDALGDDAVVLMDSGIRRGADVIKALALGADAVLLGRPYVYGLAVAGQEGVERVIRNLTAEIDLTLALIGGRDVNALDRSWISPRP